MKKAGKAKASMSFAIIGMIVALLVIFGGIVSAIGYFSFTNAIKSEYETTTRHMADTAAALVNGDHLTDYLEGREMEEYEASSRNLDGFVWKMNVTMVYVIQVDTSDYGRFVSIFNVINNSVDNSDYTPWEIGHRRDTTNQEYRDKYRKMYEQTAPYETVYRMNPTDGQHPHITTMVPVKDMYNNTVGILCVQRPVSEISKVTGPYLNIIAVSTILLALVASAFIALYIRRRFVKPIRKVSAEAVRFARDNEKGEPLEGISRLREINNLAVSICTIGIF